MENQINFIETYVFPKIIAENTDLNGLDFVRSSISTSSTVDGFRGNIIFASLEFETKDKEKIDVGIVVKLMKPPSSPSRVDSCADYQFVNEVFVYKNVIPTFLTKFQSKFKKIEKHLWCPQVYLTECGKFPGLSDETETILAMENLTHKNFTLGPRIDLTIEELTLMAEAIAQFHACTYALRINNDPDLNVIVSEIIPFTFEKSKSYERSYITALERLFTYLDNNPNEVDDKIFERNLSILRAKYANDPLPLMERFLCSENQFSVILHGDYNRNNVLFKYEQKKAVDLRFIDFQEVKYGSPAIDLSFFMYMNIHPSLFENGFNEKLLSFYHEKLIESLCELLDCKRNDPRLSAYGWDNFYEHYKQFAFYGAMVSVMFIPWMACAEDECAKLADELEKDYFSEELKQLSLICGGKEIDKRIVAVVRNASKLGFMEMLTND